MSTATVPIRKSYRRKSDSAANRQTDAVQRRTTVTLSAKATSIVSEFQEATGLSISEAISELIERTEEATARITFVDGIPVADLPLTGKWIDNDDVLRAQAELG
jgi:hypothetical protein